MSKGGPGGPGKSGGPGTQNVHRGQRWIVLCMPQLLAVPIIYLRDGTQQRKQVFVVMESEMSAVAVAEPYRDKDHGHLVVRTRFCVSTLYNASGHALKNGEFFFYRDVLVDDFAARVPNLLADEVSKRGASRLERANEDPYWLGQIKQKAEQAQRAAEQRLQMSENRRRSAAISGVRPEKMIVDEMSSAGGVFFWPVSEPGGAGSS